MRLMMRKILLGTILAALALALPANAATAASQWLDNGYPVASPPSKVLPIEALYRASLTFVVPGAGRITCIVLGEMELEGTAGQANGLYSPRCTEHEKWYEALSGGFYPLGSPSLLGARTNLPWAVTVTRNPNRPSPELGLSGVKLTLAEPSGAEVTMEGALSFTLANGAGNGLSPSEIATYTTSYLSSALGPVRYYGSGHLSGAAFNELVTYE